MNPFDYFLLLLPLVYAALSIALHGWTMNGVGPALLGIAGGLWQFAFQWLRYRSWLRHKDSDFIPGTQHLALAAIAGWAVATFAALGWSMRTFKELRLRSQLAPRPAHSESESENSAPWCRISPFARHWPSHAIDADGSGRQLV